MTGGRNSFNVDAKRVGGERGYLVEWVRETKPTTLGIMDDFTLAVDCKQASPSTLVWHRAYGDSEAHSRDPRQAKNPRDLARRYRDEGYGHFDILAYGVNEPVGDWDYVARWQADHFDEARKVGVKCIGLNVGPAAIEVPQIPQLEPYFAAYYEHEGWHYHGEHDYTGFLLPWGGGWGGRSPEDLFDANKIQLDRWTKPAEYNLDQAYHMRRGERFDAYNRARGRLNPLKRIVTEYGKDRMMDWEAWPLGNIYQRAQSRWGSNGYELIRGFNSFAGFIEAQFNQPMLTVLEWEMQWTERFYPAHYLGFNWFQWCPLTPDWDIRFGFDISRHRSLHRFMTSLKNGGSTAPVEPNPMPVEDKPKPAAAAPWYEGNAQPPAQFMNLRAAPDTDGRDIGDVNLGDQVRLYKGGEVNADGYWWNWVDVMTGSAAGKSGWMARVRTTWEAIIVPSWNFAPVILTVPFTDQYIPEAGDPARYNNCLEATVHMVIAYYRLTASLLDVINRVNNDGLYAHLQDGEQVLNFYGKTVIDAPNMSHIRTGVGLWALYDEIKAGRPFIALVLRQHLGFDFGNFDGNHFVVVVGMQGNKVALLDPLRHEDEFNGPEWVDIPVFLKAWESTVGNSGTFQGLAVNPLWHEKRLEQIADDETPPLSTIITSDEVEQIAQVFTGLHLALTQTRDLNTAILGLLQQGADVFRDISNRMRSS